MTALLGTFTKQSTETLDYDVDYSDWFSNRSDAPSSHVVVVEPGVTLVSSNRSGNVVRAVLSGGTNGQAYKVTVRLTTTAGLVKEADFRVRIKDV